MPKTRVPRPSWWNSLAEALILTILGGILWGCYSVLLWWVSDYRYGISVIVGNPHVPYREMATVFMVSIWISFGLAAVALVALLAGDAVDKRRQRQPPSLQHGENQTLRCT